MKGKRKVTEWRCSVTGMIIRGYDYCPDAEAFAWFILLAKSEAFLSRARGWGEITRQAIDRDPEAAFEYTAPEKGTAYHLREFDKGELPESPKPEVVEPEVMPPERKKDVKVYPTHTEEQLDLTGAEDGLDPDLPLSDELDLNQEPPGLDQDPMKMDLGDWDIDEIVPEDE